jgi:hypothetical protein
MIGNAGSYAIVSKVSSSGTVSWTRRIFGIAEDNNLMHAAEGEGGGTYLALQAFGFFRLIQLDQEGNVSWCKKFQMPGDDKPTGMLRFPNGELWISGTGWLMACSNSGDVLWARGIPHLILDMEAALEADGVFLVGRDGNDGWVMRTDINGQVPGCADSSFIPTITPEDLVSTSFSPPSPNSGLSAYAASVVSGVLPTTVVDCIPTAIQVEPAVGSVFHAYPVPFSHQLTIELPGSGLRLELSDAQGRILRSLETTMETSFIMDRGDLLPGLYLLRLLKGQSQVAVRTVVVE